MNNNIRKLHRIASARSRTIVGLMSGTSLDGLDIALCRFFGSGPATRLKLMEFETIPYTDEERSRILAVFARQQVDFAKLSELHPWIAVRHAQMILGCLRKWKIIASRVNAIASHGQTVFHAPKAVTPGASINSTFQVGDGDHLAVTTGILTISDFRQKHLAAGGEGAPLAVYGDYLLFSKKSEDRILLNMGGIANFTFLPGSAAISRVFVTDTGPGNTLIDQAMRELAGQPFDRDSLMALKGKVNGQLLEALKRHPFFALPFPRTTGPEQFNLRFVRDAQASSGTGSISTEDLVATLTRFSAETITEAIAKSSGTRKRFRIFMSGGGAHNPLLVRWIGENLPGVSLERFDSLGISGDAKEAVLFAALANETLAGGHLNFGSRARIPSVSMGKISFPL